MAVNTIPWPTELTLDQPAKVLKISFDDGLHFEFSFEFLRVQSPSAEVRGHGPGQEVLQLNKQDVGILELKPVGNYGVQIVFNDGHDTGIYSWAWLREIGENQPFLWGRYLELVAQHKAESKA